jgi:N-acetylneuraminic acid mutarotase
MVSEAEPAHDPAPSSSAGRSQRPAGDVHGSGDASSDRGRPGHLRSTSRWRRRVRRGLRALGLAVLATVVLLAVVSGVLIATNADPTDRPGWTRGADLAGGRGEVASTVADGRVIVVGGLRGPGRTSASVEAYDPATDAWASLPDLPAPRHHAAAAALDDGTVYVSGGARSATDWSPRAEVWTLEPGAASWEPVDPLPEGRLGHAMVALDGQLHVVGGDGETSDVLTLEPEAGWQRGAPLGLRPDHVRAVVLEDEVWAIGGRVDDDSLVDRVDVYDPSTDSWRSGPVLPDPTSAMAVGVLDGSIHVVGGEDPGLLGGRVFDRHLVLRPGGDRWEELGPTMLAVHGAGYGVVDDELVVAGGARRQGLLSVLSWTGVTQRYSDPDG